VLVAGLVPPALRRQTSLRALPALPSCPAVATAVVAVSATEVVVGVEAVTASVPLSCRLLAYDHLCLSAAVVVVGPP
jgi:hypothetical protein